MADRNAEVEARIAQMEQADRLEYAEYMRKARSDALEGIVGYLQALTLDGERTDMEDTHVEGLVALVRVFLHIENVASHLERGSMADSPTIRGFIKHALDTEVAS